uniref:Transcriptional-regulating factor 1-like n=1 Tax=Oryzias sinensis TaxID=183150 RepID=A0A8C7YK39_9TELE
MHAKRSSSAKDGLSSNSRRAIMEDCSSPTPFLNLQHHRHLPPFPLILASCQSSDVGYSTSQSGPDSQEQNRHKGEEATASFLPSNGPSVLRKGSSSSSDRAFLSTSAGSLNGDTSLGEAFDGDDRLSSSLVDSWFGKKEMWEGRESFDRAAEEFNDRSDCYRNTNDAFYTLSCSSEDSDRCRIRTNYDNYETGHEREANMSVFTKQTVSFSRASSTGGFNDKAEYCREDSRVSDNYLGGEDDFGSSCGSGEDQFQPAEADGPWLNMSPTSQAEEKWRVAADGHLTAGHAPQTAGVSSRTFTQKLDSFSKAFLSQRKRRFPTHSSGRVWEFGVGRGETSGSVQSRQSCAFDSNTYQPPSTSPSYSSLSSYPSPPTSSHLMCSVLSPPPTPLPPPSISPSKMDSPSTQGVSGPPLGGDSLGGLQFFPSRVPSVPPVQSGMIWKSPLLSYCFPQTSGDPNNNEFGLKSHNQDDSSKPTAVCDIPHAGKSTSLNPSSHLLSSSSSKAACLTGSPSLLPSSHLPLGSSFFSAKHLQVVERTAPFNVNQNTKSDSTSLKESHLQQQATSNYIGAPFPSNLHPKRSQKRGCHTPRPLLNPLRKGTGLYSSLPPLHHMEAEAAREEEEEAWDELPRINVGPDFQADLPPCHVDDELSGVWFLEEAPPREQLLWKPWDELQESTHLQDQVEKLLSVCSSSCLPGGGSNTELALHCLHYCQGNTMATLEMLLFSQHSPAGDYHYSGCDFWTDTEKSLFTAALETHGKDFALIEKTVRTKTVAQCVEFYYLGKKLVDKQRKQKEAECRNAEVELQKSVTPVSQPVNRQFGLEEVVPIPSLASFFPCKLCGKMFYKIKSRNAHMKIHRQPQEDWTDRRLQHEILTQRLALSRPASLMPNPAANLLPSQAATLTFSSSGLVSNRKKAENLHNSNGNPIASGNASIPGPNTPVNYNDIAPSTSHIITINNIDNSDTNRREASSFLPFHQSWSSFGHLPDLSTFYCIPEGKDDLGAATVEGKEPLSWQ